MSDLSIFIKSLEKEQTLKISPIGHSMCPFLLGGRDYVYLSIPVFPLRRGDIALFMRPDGTHVIHRIYKVIKTAKGNEYLFMGDNQTWTEGPIPEAEIMAVSNQILRKGRLIDCNSNHFYRFMASVWILIRPIRPVILRLFS